MNKYLLFLIFILSGILSACQNKVKSDQNLLNHAYFEGTYRFSDFESMTVGAWFLEDSVCLLFKKIDAEQEYKVTSGYYKMSKGLYVVDAGNEGRLVFRCDNLQLEVMNNEGEPIGRNAKFILSKNGESPDPKLIFSAQVSFSDTEQNVLSICPSAYKMHYQFEQSDANQQILDENKVYLVQLSVLQNSLTQIPQLKFIRIVKELSTESCNQ